MKKILGVWALVVLQSDAFAVETVTIHVKARVPAVFGFTAEGIERNVELLQNDTRNLAAEADRSLEFTPQLDGQATITVTSTYNEGEKCRINNTEKFAEYRIVIKGLGGEDVELKHGRTSNPLEFTGGRPFRLVFSVNTEELRRIGNYEDTLTVTFSAI
ncbi:MAG: hypothetical protein LBO73_02880 [Holosporaceae bacterium]|jgi:hypothetical protein|nr:hypothetical protein [Holosporaceae bacterium]